MVSPLDAKVLLVAAVLAASAQRPAERIALADRERLAHLINAYNGVVRANPARKAGPLGFVKFFFLDRHQIDGNSRTLWAVERQIRDFQDPRVHFALNCGARSCPPIRRYEGRHLGEQLDTATRAYLADPAGARFAPATRTLFLSRLFQWYRSDFGNPLEFALRYLPPDEAQAIQATPGLKIKYLDWDWTAIHS